MEDTAKPNSDYIVQDACKGDYLFSYSAVANNLAIVAEDTMVNTLAKQTGNTIATCEDYLSTDTTWFLENAQIKDANSGIPSTPDLVITSTDGTSIGTLGTPLPQDPQWSTLRPQSFSCTVCKKDMGQELHVRAEWNGRTELFCQKCQAELMFLAADLLREKMGIAKCSVCQDRKYVETDGLPSVCPECGSKPGK